MLAFHPVTSSCCLLRAKWSIRQAACTIRCSLKTRFPRINNLNLYYENESNVISAGFSHVQSSELTLASSLRINEDQRMRSSGFHCFIIVKTSRLLCFYNTFCFEYLLKHRQCHFFFNARSWIRPDNSCSQGKQNVPNKYQRKEDQNSEHSNN